MDALDDQERGGKCDQFALPSESARGSRKRFERARDWLLRGHLLHTAGGRKPSSTLGYSRSRGAPESPERSRPKSRRGSQHLRQSLGLVEGQIHRRVSTVIERPALGRHPGITGAIGTDVFEQFQLRCVTQALVAEIVRRIEGFKVLNVALTIMPLAQKLGTLRFCACYCTTTVCTWHNINFTSHFSVVNLKLSANFQFSASLLLAIQTARRTTPLSCISHYDTGATALRAGCRFRQLPA